MDRGERFNLAVTICLTIAALLGFLMVQQCTISTNTQDNNAHIACIQKGGNWAVDGAAYGRCVITPEPTQK